MQLDKKRLVFISIASILLAEVLSFVTFSYPSTNLWIFALAALLALILTVYKLEWGVYLIFAELAIGSFGKLFVLQIGGVELSIRVVLWLIVMSVWIGRILLPQGEGGHIAFLRSQFFKPYLALAFCLGWGIVWGLGRGHDFGTVFFDVNNYLYFLLIFPVYDVLHRADAIKRVGTILLAAISWLSIKTIVLFYIFSHELFGLQDVLYDWSRHLQLAEITNISPLAITSRIFMQSQIWVLFGLFMAFGLLFPLLTKEGVRGRSTRQQILLLLILATALIMSFSRSFWLAGVLSLGVFLILLLIQRERFGRVFYFGISSLAIMALGAGLTLGVAAFPVPAGAPGSSSILKERIEKFKEAAASSRMSQIRPLLTAIAKHPAIGSGFGQAVTYQSQDPRVVKSHPDGWYTTTAFELGWLEMWLKIGLLGVLAYLYLLWRILKAGWQKIKATRIYELHPNDPNKNSEHSDVHSGYSDRYLIFGAMAGLVAIVITHGVSPYLNHPLGIGIVLLLTGVFDSGLVKE